jgi:hypothetical protein
VIIAKYIYKNSIFILSVCLLIMLDTFITRTITTLQHFATLHHTSPNYTSLHFTTLHFLTFTLHYPLIWLNPSTFPTVLSHLTSLNKPQYLSPISKLISKIMSPFTALKEHSPFHFTFYLFINFFTSPITPSLHFTLLIISTTHFPSLPFTFYFLSPTLPLTGFHFPNPPFENMRFTVGSPYHPFR